MVRSRRADAAWLAVALAACGTTVPEAGERFDRCDDAEAVAWFGEADELVARGELAAALPKLRRCVERCPDTVQYHLEYQRIAKQLGGDAEAAMLRYYTDMPDDRGSPVPAYVKSHLVEDAATRDAILTEVIDRDPSFYYAYLSRARMQADLRRTDKALDALRAALEAKPDSADANIELAELLVSLNRPAEAVEYYRRYLEIRPEERQAKKHLFKLLVYDLERFDDAEPIVEELLETGPTDVVVLEDLAALRWKLGDLPTAVQLYHRVLEIDPERPRAVLNLGNLYYDAYPTDEASRRRWWPLARNAYRYYSSMTVGDDLWDVFDSYLAVKVRLRAIDQLLGPDERETVTLEDF